MYKNNPLAWLTRGPGRERLGRAGYTAPVQGQAQDPEEGLEEQEQEGPFEDLLLEE